MYLDNFPQITAVYVAYLNDFVCNCLQKQTVGGNPDVSEKYWFSNVVIHTMNCRRDIKFSYAKVNEAGEMV